jgi:hypothetical protein
MHQQHTLLHNIFGNPWKCVQTEIMYSCDELFILYTVYMHGPHYHSMLRHT